MLGRAFCFGGASQKLPERFSAVTNLITVWLLLTLYSCGNVIVLVIVHFTNNWFMMILVAVYVYLEIKCYEVTAVANLTSQILHHQVLR